jgi:hypothetical protein
MFLIREGTSYGGSLEYSWISPSRSCCAIARLCFEIPLSAREALTGPQVRASVRDQNSQLH